MKVRIDAHVLQIVGEPAGGIRRHVHAILFGLKDTEGLRQSYVCADAGGDAAFEKELPDLKALLGPGLLRLPVSKRPGPRDILNVIRLARFVRERGITIVHGHGAKGGAYARLLAAFCGVKAVYTPHGGAVHRMFGRAEEVVYTTVEKALLLFTDYCLFESRYSADAYFAKVGRQPKAWSVNHNGVPVPDIPSLERAAAALKLLRDEEALNIGVFGILRPQKGQAVALEAAAELAARGVKFRMHFFGRGPDRKALEAEAARLGLVGDVVFHGEVEAPFPHMYSMGVVLIPSLFESFGYVAIEAFSLGKPVVASAVGGLKEIIVDGQTGRLVPPEAPESMADALQYLSRNPKFRRMLGSNASAVMHRDFTEARMLEGIKTVYFSFCSQEARL